MTGVEARVSDRGRRSEGRRDRDGQKPLSPEERGSLGERLGVDIGLCAFCAHLRLVGSSRSLFVRCALAETQPRFPRYPVLPVLACDGYIEAGRADREG